MPAKVGRHSPVFSALIGVLKSEKRVKDFLSAQQEGTPEMELLQRAITQAQEQPLLLTPAEAFENLRDQKIKRQLLYTLSDMALTGLPYDCPFDEDKQKFITHVERNVKMFNGNLRVVFATVDPNVSLPYGMNDRKMFMALCTLAVLQQSRKIAIPDTIDLIHQYLNRRTDGGENYNDLIASLERLSKLVIMMEYTDGVRILGGKQGIVQSFYLPANPRLKVPRKASAASVKPLWASHQDEFQLMLEQSFVDEVVDNAYPFPHGYLAPFMEDAPFAWDLALFLPRRCSNANSTSAIPLPSLQEQLGSRDSNKIRFRLKVEKQLEVIRYQWDQTIGRKNCCPAYIYNNALIVGPVKPGNELVPRVEKGNSRLFSAAPDDHPHAEFLPGFEECI